jgi:hypothetical protein
VEIEDVMVVIAVFICKTSTISDNSSRVGVDVKIVVVGAVVSTIVIEANCEPR